SLKPETGITSRTKIELEMRDNELFLVITAKDSTALRAGINSYLRWLNEALEVYERTSE
ncbi:MAG: hypothetical protein KAU14_07230, partial [Thermoplasmata archaeon]|nr:hypothetical protein [Thermoplasmata archaeon]